MEYRNLEDGETIPEKYEFQNTSGQWHPSELFGGKIWKEGMEIIRVPVIHSCGVCGFENTGMMEFSIIPHGERINERKIHLCEICANTWDPIVGVEYPRNLGTFDTFRILRTMAKIGMMILSRLDKNSVKMDRILNIMEKRP